MFNLDYCGNRCKLLFVLMALETIGYAQSTKQKTSSYDYVVLNSGDTLYGYVDEYKPHWKNSFDLRFETIRRKKLKLKAAELLCYRKDNTLFKRKFFERPADRPEVEALMEVVTAGPYSLYRFEYPKKFFTGEEISGQKDFFYEGGTDFYLEKPSGAIVLLHRENYKEVFRTLFADNKILKTQILSNKLGFNDLATIVSIYNKENGFYAARVSE